MKTFRTIISPGVFDFEINYNTKLMFLGSCFTENIGKKLKEQKFKIKINPFGIIYNPISVSDSLNFIAERTFFSENDLIYYDENWHSFHHHGKFSGKDKEAVSENINSEINRSFEYLKNADYIFITFGTSWVYEYAETGEIVANCHKIPSYKFKKRLLNTEEIVKKISETVNTARKLNPNLKFVFSVSPVRHLKDGFSQNFISKSILRVAIKEICDLFAGTYYFPAYEILTDDLRDYRFYAEDMVHPNETAVEYIFDFFRESFFSDETKKIFDKITKIISARNHRIFDLNSEKTKKFIKKNIEEIKILEKLYPVINFDEEKKYFSNLFSDILK